MIQRRALTAAFAAFALLADGDAARAQTGKVTVVTSFAKDVTDPIKRAFEKAVPGVSLE
ncbi:MAG: ABC transporter substrate-binding protein, partial [bacterium]